MKSGLCSCSQQRFPERVGCGCRSRGNEVKSTVLLLLFRAPWSSVSGLTADKSCLLSDC